MTLTPSETVQMDKRKILAFVTVHGSTNSHTAILARMMNIPALIGVPVELDSLHSGTMGIVDGKDAVFCVDPDEATIAAAHEMQARAAEAEAAACKLQGTSFGDEEWPEGKRICKHRQCFRCRICTGK